MTNIHFSAVILVGLLTPVASIAEHTHIHKTLPVQKAQVGQVQIVEAKDINWGYLNPLRGDKSPRAANLWGDRTKNVSTGMLVKFKDGFSSPPHIHNVTYRGVVINGLVHNDDPAAAKLWMPAGSYWTQPAGENHITAAQGKTVSYF